MQPKLDVVYPTAKVTRKRFNNGSMMNARTHDPPSNAVVVLAR